MASDLCLDCLLKPVFRHFRVNPILINLDKNALVIYVKNEIAGPTTHPRCDKAI